jgi:hypothetical protein
MEHERTTYAVTQAHREAIAVSLNELVSALQDRLSRRVTAHMAGVDSAKTITRWANGDGDLPPICSPTIMRVRLLLDVPPGLVHPKG